MRETDRLPRDCDGDTVRFVCGALVLVLGFALGIAEAHALTRMATQEPCTTTAGPCVSFNDTQAIPLVRSFAFQAPAAGMTQVSFHGSLVCSKSGNTNAVVDLVSAINHTPNTEPTLNGPSALRHALSFERGSRTETFNLASKRAFLIQAPGTQTYYFRLARLRMDPGTSCVVYNATFSILFGN